MGKQMVPISGYLSGKASDGLPDAWDRQHRLFYGEDIADADDEEGASGPSIKNLRVGGWRMPDLPLYRHCL